MKYKIFILGSIFVTFLGVGATGWFLMPIYSIEKNVKKNLIDPESARFTNITFHRDTGAGCGVVNSKNKMGGYAGETEFISFSDNRVIFNSLGDASKKLEYCKGINSSYSKLECLEKAKNEVDEILVFLEQKSRQCPELP